MADPKHARLRGLFDRALDLPRAQRSSFLESQCAGDAELKARVEALLVAAEDERFLASPTGSKPPAAADASDESVAPLREGPGTRIGPYKLLQLIGEGGFGAVFMAEQEKPVARRVALKIIKLGMDTRQVVARFEQERQALALMDHPNIARVIDAGATETGRPYFVMDLVKGEPIVEYCDKHELPIDERLDLFAQVCAAVQHAHSKGIIHRDLKPSNILVATQDGRPQAKVIDFGIAKATSAKLTDKTLFTEHQQIIGTLQYMSPEQAQGSLDIDTRTDVYALGVVLYELLTGSTPFDANSIREAFYSELQRMIREVDPPKPSTRLNESADTLASVAASRRVEPKRLGTIVRGELDWIVMKALEKDRARRYESAHGLALDIRRYLDGEAVLAAPPSAVYRFQKFVRRNRVSVLAGSAVAVALLFGLAAFAWQARVARNERDKARAAETAATLQRSIANEQKLEAEKQQQIAEASASAEARARKRAEATTSFMTDALRSADPNYGGEQGITVAEAMMQAATQLDVGAFEDDPDIEANMRGVIADILSRNGKIAEALPMAERALSLFEAQGRGDSTELANALNHVATIQQDLGRLDLAEPLFVRALEMVRRLHPGDHADVTVALNNLGVLRAFMGRIAEAEPLLTESQAMKERLIPGDSPDVAMGLNNLGILHHKLGRDEEAAEMYERSLAMYERLFDEHPQLAMAIYNLAQTRGEQGRWGEAEELMTTALDMYRRLFHGDHRDVARALSGLANSRRWLGRFAEAERLYMEALEMEQRLFRGDHPMIAAEFISLAYLNKARGQLAEAEAYASRALEMQRRLHEEGHPDVASAIALLAELQFELGRDANAEPLLTEEIELQRRLHDGDHADVARAMNRLADFYLEHGRAEEAEQLCRDALAMLQRVYTDDHPRLAAGMASLAFVFLATDRAEEAESLLDEAARMDQRFFGGDHDDVALALVHLAHARRALGRTAEERDAFDDAIAMQRRLVPTGSAHLASALWESGRARLADGDLAAALPELEEAVALAERLLAPDSWDTRRYRETLASCREALRR